MIISFLADEQLDFARNAITSAQIMISSEETFARETLACCKKAVINIKSENERRFKELPCSFQKIKVNCRPLEQILMMTITFVNC